MPALNSEKKVSHETATLRRIAWLVGPPPLKSGCTEELQIPSSKSSAAIVESSSLAPVPPPPMTSQPHSQRLTVSGAPVCPPPLSCRPALTIDEVRQFLRQLSAADSRAATVKKNRRASILTLVLGRAQSPALA